MKRVPKEVASALESCGIPYTTKFSGKGRLVVTLADQSITIRTQTFGKGRELQNVIHRVKRIAEGRHT